ncbi:MAG: hypothetical protein Q7S06_02015 [Nanoarchaeota archaeon]|nr:hypothetical protein [Nanoarchaeota archaeon]
MDSEEKIEEEKIDEEKAEDKNKHNKIIIGVFIAIIFVAALFVVVHLIVNSMNQFTYKGVEFAIDKTTLVGKTVYRTSIPVERKDSITGKMISSADYNFWLRNDPRQLDKKVPVTNGKLNFAKNIVLDLTTDKLFCEGDWNIGLQNSLNLFHLLGFNVSVKNNTTEYGSASEFMFITIQIGNSTNIEKKSPEMNLDNKGEVQTKDENSYNLNVNNCEVIPAFERLMLEAFARYAEVA